MVYDYLSADKGPEVFEGDMVLSGKQNQLIKEAIKTGKSISSIESEKFAATTAVFPKWTNGIVPYVLSSSLSTLHRVIYPPFISIMSSIDIQLYSHNFVGNLRLLLSRILCSKCFLMINARL